MKIKYFICLLIIIIISSIVWNFSCDSDNEMLSWVEDGGDYYENDTSPIIVEASKIVFEDYFRNKINFNDADNYLENLIKKYSADKNLKNEIIIWKSKLYYMDNRYSSAGEILENIINSYPKNSKKLLKIYVRLGNIYSLKDENDTSLIYYKKAETINKDVNNNYYNYQIFSGKIIVKYRKLQKEIKKPFLKNKSVENRINDILLDIDDLTKNSYFSSFGDKIEFFTRKYRLLKYLGKLDKATNEKKNIEKLLNIMKTKNIISKHKMKRLKKDIFNDELL